MNKIGLRHVAIDEQRPLSGAPPGSSRVEFAGLYEQHARTIHRYLARRVGTELADDLTADTFVVAWRRWSSYDHELGTPVAWLYGIATNLARRHRRREEAGLRASQRVDTLPADLFDLADGVASRVDASERVARLSSAIAGLKPDDRDVLLLIAWAELSYEQVAQALDIPIGTVRSRLHRVRRQLQSAETFSLKDKEEWR